MGLALPCTGQGPLTGTSLLQVSRSHQATLNDKISCAIQSHHALARAQTHGAFESGHLGPFPSPPG